MKSKSSKNHIVFTAITAALVVVGIVLNVLAFGVFSDVLTIYFGKSDVQTNADNRSIEEIQTEARALSKKIGEEGLVLLDNNGTLPLKGKTVDILGYAAANPFYGGSGSGAYSDTAKPISFLTAFKSAGWTVNENLIESYPKDGYDSSINSAFPLNEVDPETYWSKTNSGAELAVVVFGRTGGENADLPTEGYGADGKKSYLELSDNEVALVKKAAATYKNVVVALNTANAMDMTEIKKLYSDEVGKSGNVDGVIWVGKPGYYGLTALEEVISGKTNPSGKLVDTWAADVMSAPASKTLAENAYTNLKIKSSTSKGLDGNAHYLQYNEGIFVGYRYYETATELGYIDYAKSVVYPFGHGLSYTSFEQTIESSDIPAEIKGDSEITVKVKVKNTGSAAGKSVVQLYFTLNEEALKAAKLDHSAATLVAFAKTKEIAAGGEETVELKVLVEDIASYDDKGVYAADGAYVFEAGKYGLELRSDSHNAFPSAKVDFEAKKPVVYAASSLVSGADTSVTKRKSDAKSVNNAFGKYSESTLNGNKYGINVKYLSISSPKEDWLGAIAHKGNEEAVSSLVDFLAEDNNMSIKNKGYEVKNDAVTKESGGTLNINDFKNTDYSDPLWQQLVEQMTVAEMNKLITMGGYKTEACGTVGKLETVESDGGSSLCYFAAPSKYPGVAYPTPIVIASTWNEALAEQVGQSVAAECIYYKITGWYAPGANIHRTPFSGRSFEYYSEDPTLSAFMAMNVSSGATEKGVVTYVKHFVLNDTEANRYNNLCVWTNEQAMRELYLKAFEYAVKAESKFEKHSTTGIMSSFNYVGDRWAGASYELLTGVLREEWGFKGTVITDYFGGYGYMNYDCAIRAGNDLMLNTLKTSGKLSKSSNDDLYYMQQSAKNILYTYSRSYYVEAKSAGGTKGWVVVAILINVVWWLATAATGVLTFLAWKKNLFNKKSAVAD